MFEKPVADTENAPRSATKVDKIVKRRHQGVVETILAGTSSLQGETDIDRFTVREDKVGSGTAEGISALVNHRMAPNRTNPNSSRVCSSRCLTSHVKGDGVPTRPRRTQPSQGVTLQSALPRMLSMLGQTITNARIRTVVSVCVSSWAVNSGLARRVSSVRDTGTPST